MQFHFCCEMFVRLKILSAVLFCFDSLIYHVAVYYAAGLCEVVRSLFCWRLAGKYSHQLVFCGDDFFAIENYTFYHLCVAGQ